MAKMATSKVRDSTLGRQNDGGLLRLATRGEARPSIKNFPKQKRRHLSAADLTHYHSPRDDSWTIKGKYLPRGVLAAQAKGDIINDSFD